MSFEPSFTKRANSCQLPLSSLSSFLSILVLIIIIIIIIISIIIIIIIVIIQLMLSTVTNTNSSSPLTSFRCHRHHYFSGDDRTQPPAISSHANQHFSPCSSCDPWKPHWIQSDSPPDMSRFAASSRVRSWMPSLSSFRQHRPPLHCHH